MQQYISNEDFCGSLPLHFINQIQAYGVLVVVDTNGDIIQVSNNIHRLFGKEPADIVEQPLERFLSSTTMKRMNNVLQSGRQGQRIVLVSLQEGNEHYPAVVHPGEQFHILEIELAPAGQQSFISVYEELKGAMSNVQESNSIEDACQSALSELKTFSDFDRLMVYKFDEAWNGTVIAQIREDYMSDYLGLRFPASDIPRQARALYQTNPYRLIPDRSYEPIKLYPIINPITSSFTDLSSCNLRSVAGVHLEYMANMDTMASMSTRILIDGRLWGLISCHHKEAKQLSYEECSVFELISDVLASRIGNLETATQSTTTIRLQQDLSRFVEQLYRKGDMVNLICEGQLMEMFRATGLIYAHGFQLQHCGEVPDDKAIRDLLFWLGTRHNTSIYATRSLNSEFNEWKDYDGPICGMLSIPIRSEQQEYLIFFRREVLEEVNWGGNPADALQMESDGKSYHPRNSFSIWKESVSGHSTLWSFSELELATSLRQAITEYLLRQA